MRSAVTGPCCATQWRVRTVSPSLPCAGPDRGSKTPGNLLIFSTWPLLPRRMVQREASHGQYLARAETREQREDHGIEGIDSVWQDRVFRARLPGKKNGPGKAPAEHHRQGAAREGDERATRVIHSRTTQSPAVPQGSCANGDQTCPCPQELRSRRLRRRSFQPWTRGRASTSSSLRGHL